MRLRIGEWLATVRGRYQFGAVFKDHRLLLQQIEVALAIFDKNLSFPQFVAKLYSTLSDQLRSFKIRFDLFPQTLDSTQKLDGISHKRNLSL